MLFCSAQGHGGIGYGVLEANVCARRCAGAFSACDARRLCSQRNGRAVLRILDRCAIKSQLGSDTLLRLSWVLGFVSAENQRLSASAPKKVKSFDLAKGLDLPAIAAWLDKFCAEQLSKPIVAATQALVLEQAKEQGALEGR